MKRSGIVWNGLMAASLTLLVAAPLLSRADEKKAAPKAGTKKEAGKHGPIAWNESLENAKKLAAKTNRPIFVDFYAEWCGPCKEMLKTTYRDKRVVAQSKKFVPVLIDIDKQPELAKQFEVESIPTVVFLDAKGKELNRTTGYAEPNDFLKLMDEAAKKK